MEELLSLNSSKRHTGQSALLYLSATVILQLDFLPSTPLHCTVIQKGKLNYIIIIHLPQTDASKRKHVLAFHSLLAPAYCEIRGTWGLFLSFLFLQLPGRGRKGCRSLNLNVSHLVGLYQIFNIIVM